MSKDPGGSEERDAQHSGHIALHVASAGMAEHDAGLPEPGLSDLAGSIMDPSAAAAIHLTQQQQQQQPIFPQQVRVALSFTIFDPSHFTKALAVRGARSWSEGASQCWTTALLLPLRRAAQN